MFESYGDKVKIKLIEIGMRQKELADIIGISEANLSSILSGKRKGWKHRDAIEYTLKNKSKMKSAV